MKKVLVISPHPDDETLGCGGTLLKHIENKDEVHWMICTVMTEEQGYTIKAITEKNDLINDVKKKYNFKNTISLNIPTCDVHNYSFNMLIEKLSYYINSIEPEIIYMPNRGDIHTDHQIISKAILSSTKSFRVGSIKKIMMYETLSETEYAPPLQENIFIPNVFVDISDYVDSKLEILSMYKTEILDSPFPRSVENIRALAKYRGCSINKMYAEAFMLIKEIL